MRQRKRKFLIRPRIDGIVLRNRVDRNLQQKRRRFFPMLSEVEVIYHRPKHSQMVRIATSKDAYELLIQLFDPRKIDYKEMFYVIFLSRANTCLWYSQIGIGSDCEVTVHIKEILQLALKTNACGLILSHNHPSGRLTGSIPDRRLTEKVREACRFFDVHVLDHIILSSEGYISLQEEGLM